VNEATKIARRLRRPTGCLLRPARVLVAIGESLP
jgi:hypothetical protein